MITTAIDIALNNTSLATTSSVPSHQDEHLTHARTVHINGSFIAQEIYLGLLCVFGILGNGLVCFIIIRRTHVKHATWHYLCCLSFADMFVCAVNIPTLMYTTYDETAIDSGTILCQFNGFSLVCFFLVSLLTLAAISIHKYVHIRRPIQSIRASNNSLKIIGVIWVVSIGIALGPLVGWSQYSHVHGHKQCTPASMKPSTNTDYSYLIVLMVTGFFLPLIAMVYCYTVILIETISHHRRLQTTSIRGKLQVAASKRRRGSLIVDFGIIKTVVVVVSAFIACWAPFVVYLCCNFARDAEPSFTLAQVAFMMGYTQSVVNPVIYALRHDIFRNQFHSLLCCFKYSNEEIARSASAGGHAGRSDMFSIRRISSTASSASNTYLVRYRNDDMKNSINKQALHSLQRSPITFKEPKLTKIPETIPSIPSYYDNKVFQVDS